jgi:hypothetical protein
MPVGEILITCLKAIPGLKAVIDFFARRRSPRGAAMGMSIPRYGWDVLREMEYEGVIWHVQTKRRHSVDSVAYIFDDRVPSAEDIHVDRTPYCPQTSCRVSLEERKRPWWRGGRYKWYCVGCGFEKVSKIPMYQASRRAEKKVQGQYRVHGY